MTDLRDTDLTCPEPSEPLRCPTCGAVATVDPDTEIGGRCGVCGAPRVLVQAGQAANRSLRSARVHQVRRRRWRWTALLSCVAGWPLGVALLLASFICERGMLPPRSRDLIRALQTSLTDLALSLSTGGIAVLAGSTALAAVAFALGRAATPRLNAETTRARVESARQMLAERGRLDISDIERGLGLDPDRAEALLVQLAADDGARLASPQHGDLAVELSTPAFATTEKGRQP